MPTSEAQLRANMKWRAKNKERINALQVIYSTNWKINNREYWNEYMRLRQYRLYHWKKIKLEFLQILLDWKRTLQNWKIIIISNNINKNN